MQHILFIIPTSGRWHALGKVVSKIRTLEATFSQITSLQTPSVVFDVIVASDVFAPAVARKQVHWVNGWIQHATPLGQHRSVLAALSTVDLDRYSHIVTLEDDLGVDTSGVIYALLASRAREGLFFLKKIQIESFLRRARRLAVRCFSGPRARHVSALAIGTPRAWRPILSLYQQQPSVYWGVAIDTLQVDVASTPHKMSANGEPTSYTILKYVSLTRYLAASWWWTQWQLIRRLIAEPAPKTPLL
jgi:hypothetical protein